MRTQHTMVPLQSIGCGSTGRAAVERSLLDLPGVLQASVNPVTEMAYVEFDAAQCREDEILAAVRRTGYSEPQLVGSSTQAPPRTIRGRLPPGRFALAAGLWLAAGFTLCAAGAALFPTLDRGYQLWALVLPGSGTLRWSTYPLGLVEALILGLFGGWLFVWVYNAIPAGRARPSQAGRPIPPPAITTRATEAM